MSMQTLALCRLAAVAMARATDRCTARLALGHMIMPMKSAPAAAASSASSGETMPHIFSSGVPTRLLLLLLARPSAAMLADLHFAGRLHKTAGIRTPESSEA
jgi:hypothetical protein